MYLFFLRMYLEFQSPFWEYGGPPISSQWSPNEYIDLDKGYRSLDSPRNICTCFS